MRRRKRYAYYLTPQGFAEKSRLTAQYLAISFDFFRLARNQCGALFAECETRGWTRIAPVRRRRARRDRHAVRREPCRDADRPRRAGPAGPGSASCRSSTISPTLAAPDAVMITDQRTPQRTYDRTRHVLPRERVLAPRLLNISRTPPRLAE